MMPGFQGSLRAAMLWVAAVAANFAALRWLSLAQNEFVLPAALIVVSLQIAAWFAVRGPARFRWFFLGFGASAAGWVALFGLSYSFPESGIQETWPFEYLRWAIGLASEYVYPQLPFGDNIHVLGAATAIFAFVPEVVVAAGVGLLAGGVFRPLSRFITERLKKGSPMKVDNSLMSEADF
jgi:hypothetical protein